jgi:hypothetical protein
MVTFYIIYLEDTLTFCHLILMTDPQDSHADPGPAFHTDPDPILDRGPFSLRVPIFSANKKMQYGHWTYTSPKGYHLKVVSNGTEGGR